MSSTNHERLLRLRNDLLNTTNDPNFMSPEPNCDNCCAGTIRKCCRKKTEPSSRECKGERYVDWQTQFDKGRNYLN